MIAMKIKHISALLLFLTPQVVCSNDNDFLSVLLSDSIEQKILATRKKKRLGSEAYTESNNCAMDGGKNYCFCQEENFWCSATRKGESSCWSGKEGSCKKGSFFTEALWCPAQCKEGTVLDDGCCYSDEILYEKISSVPIKHVGNIIMIQSDVIFGLLKDGYTKYGECGKRSDGVKLATSALLSKYDDVFDFLYVLPYYDIAEETNNFGGCTSQFNIGNDVALRKNGGALRSIIAGTPQKKGYHVASLHELGHDWLVNLDSLLPQRQAEMNGRWFSHGSHWGFTTLDKQGMLGGFAPGAFVCKKPKGRIPTKSLTCDNNKLNKLNIDKFGSVDKSNDLIGPYAKVELMIMGLMSPQEISDEEIVHCKNLKGDMNRDFTLENVSCEEILHLSAEDISNSLTADQRSKQIKEGTKLRAAHVIVFDTKYELPKDESELNDAKWKDYLKWTNDYGPELEDLFFENTYKKAKLTFSVSDNDLGCGYQNKNLCRKSPDKSKKGKGECGDLIPILKKDCPKKKKIRKLKRCLKAKYGELCRAKDRDKCETDKKLNNCNKGKFDVYRKRAPTK